MFFCWFLGHAAKFRGMVPIKSISESFCCIMPFLRRPSLPSGKGIATPIFHSQLLLAVAPSLSFLDVYVVNLPLLSGAYPSVTNDSSAAISIISHHANTQVMKCGQKIYGVILLKCLACLISSLEQMYLLSAYLMSLPLLKL